MTTVRLFLAVILLMLTALPVSAASTRLLVDQLGRPVRIPERVQRIVPLGGATRFVVYLQATDLIVGVEAMETRQPPSAARPYNLASRQKLQHLPVVGEGRQKQLNIESLMAVRPDLIITTDDDRGQADRLQRQTGIPVFVLDYGGTGVLDLQKTRQALHVMGQILGCEARTQALLAYIDRLQQELSHRVTSTSPERVYVGAVSYRGNHGITSTDTRYFPLTAAGGVNLASTLAIKGHLFIDREQLLAWNPSILLVDAVGLDLVRADVSRNRSFYRQLAAVRTKRTYVTMPYNQYHTNTELALANSWLIAKILHPQQFADVNLQAKTDEICRTFTGTSCFEKLNREFGQIGQHNLTSPALHAQR